MPLDPQSQAHLDMLAGHANDATRAWAARPTRKPPELASVWDTTAPSPDGPVPVRIYLPHGPGPHPITIYIHGGAWVGGSLDSVDPTCRFVAAQSGSLLVSVGYRLAPDTKFPGATEDCYAVAAWLAAHGDEIGGDTTRLAIFGASAGGNLAAAVTLMARDRGGPSFVHQVLMYPVTDQQMDTETYAAYGTGYLLDTERMLEARALYLRDQTDRDDPLAAPLRADDLTGLPPALVVTAEYDVLRQEGEAYAERLRQAGVQTVCTRYDGMMHTFFNAGIGFDKTFEAIGEVAATLRKAFGVA